MCHLRTLLLHPDDLQYHLGYFSDGHSTPYVLDRTPPIEAQDYLDGCLLHGSVHHHCRRSKQVSRSSQKDTLHSRTNFF